jgi:hypothetical protein
MTCYAAHKIMYVKFQDGKQDKYPILGEGDLDEQA